MNFFKNLFGTEKKVEQNFSDNHVRLFFDRNKQYYIDLGITKDFTCEDISRKYFNDIYHFLSKILNDQLLSLDDFIFVIIDEFVGKFVELKLKKRDRPMKYFKNQNTNLFYLKIEKEPDHYKLQKTLSMNIMNSMNSTTNFNVNNMSPSKNDKIIQTKLVSNIELKLNRLVF